MFGLYLCKCDFMPYFTLMHKIKQMESIFSHRKKRLVLISLGRGERNREGRRGRERGRTRNGRRGRGRERNRKCALSHMSVNSINSFKGLFNFCHFQREQNPPGEEKQVMELLKETPALSTLHLAAFSHLSLNLPQKVQN